MPKELVAATDRESGGPTLDGRLELFPFAPRQIIGNGDLFLIGARSFVTNDVRTARVVV